MRLLEHENGNGNGWVGMCIGRKRVWVVFKMNMST